MHFTFTWRRFLIGYIIGKADVEFIIGPVGVVFGKQH